MSLYVIPNVATLLFQIYIIYSVRMSKLKVFLRCPKNSHPDIYLPDGESVFVGRSPLTKVKDSRLSRNQLEFKANYLKKNVEVKVRGHNKSALNGSICGRGENKTLELGQSVELLAGSYRRTLFYQEVKSIVKEREESKSESESPPKKKMNFGGAFGWKSGLLMAMNDPAMQVDEDDRVIVIKDLFPKSKFHYLVLPRERIDDLGSLDQNHVELLEHMHETGRKMCGRHPDSDFKMGYHSVASMLQLHLHVISQDFVSGALKHKKHWNSYNTEYFLPADSVLENLRENGHVEDMVMSGDEAKEVLGRPLKCHKCSFVPKHMPDLKKHLESSHS